MFDENLRNEIQVVNTVLSVDQDNSPEMAAMFGTSLALGISDIPFDGPVAGVMVGMLLKICLRLFKLRKNLKSMLKLTKLKNDN